MRTSQERKIRDVVYRSNPLAARQATKIGIRLMKILGPGLASLAGSEDDTDFGKLAGEVAQRIACMLDEDAGLQLVMDILQETVRIDPESNTKQELKDGRVFDLVYQGNLGEMLLALGFALEVNGFFGPAGIGTLLERVTEMASRMGFQASSDSSTKI